MASWMPKASEIVICLYDRMNKMQHKTKRQTQQLRKMATLLWKKSMRSITIHPLSMERWSLVLRQRIQRPYVTNRGKKESKYPWRISSRRSIRITSSFSSILRKLWQNRFLIKRIEQIFKKLLTSCLKATTVMMPYQQQPQGSHASWLIKAVSQSGFTSSSSMRSRKKSRRNSATKCSFSPSKMTKVCQSRKLSFEGLPETRNRARTQIKMRWYNHRTTMKVTGIPTQQVIEESTFLVKVKIVWSVMHPLRWRSKRRLSSW